MDDAPRYLGSAAKKDPNCLRLAIYSMEQAMHITAIEEVASPLNRILPKTLHTQLICSKKRLM
ncbi:MAG TPA: hypothetical protein VKK79_25040 [Candidatus Lokiarchaeia archaeon]|nr:hypothetical protein [Candidatus Lokiarchaeia archaeon]